MKHMGLLVLFLVMACWAGAGFAQNKVVVIPLLADGGQKLDRWTIPPAAFTPNYHGLNFEQNTVIIPRELGKWCFNAPVYLPNGKTVTSVNAIFATEELGYDGVVELFRHPYASGLNSSEVNIAPIAHASNSSISPIMTLVLLSDDSVQSPVVDNSQYIYTAVVCMDEDVVFAAYFLTLE